MGSIKKKKKTRFFNQHEGGGPPGGNYRGPYTTQIQKRPSAAKNKHCVDLQSVLNSDGKCNRNVPEDGSCFFLSVGWLIFETQELSKVLRKMVATFISTEKNHRLAQGVISREQPSFSCPIRSLKADTIAAARYPPSTTWRSYITAFGSDTTRFAGDVHVAAITYLFSLKISIHNVFNGRLDATVN